MKQKIDFRPYLDSLAGKAFKSEDSLGRSYPNGGPRYLYNQVIDPFILDEIKIFSCPAFGDLRWKKQVFDCNDPLARNRQSHTIEGLALITQAASILGLNTGLARAIYFGHDMGYPAGAHIGEGFITKKSGREFGHEVMSVVLLRNIYDLNLSWETLQGIYQHRSHHWDPDNDLGKIQEYRLISIIDKIAILSDFEDALRRGFFTPEQLPKEFFFLGNSLQERWDNCLFSLIKESSEKGAVSYCKSEIAKNFEALYQWEYPHFYKKVNDDEDCQRDVRNLELAYDFLVNFRHVINHDPLLSIALMTNKDLEKIAKIAESRRPIIPSLLNKLEGFSFMRTLSVIPAYREINIFNPGLRPEDFC